MQVLLIHYLSHRLPSPPPGHRRSLLRLGCEGGGDGPFALVPAAFSRRACVGPGPGGTHRMSADAFFGGGHHQRVGGGAPYDVIVVDGARDAARALHDVELTLSPGVLAPGGALVLTRCKPQMGAEATAAAERPRARLVTNWSGDAWRIVAALRQRPDVDVAVGDFDWGLGVVIQRDNTAPLPSALREVSPLDLSWNDLLTDYEVRSSSCTGVAPAFRALNVCRKAAWRREPRSAERITCA